MAEKRVTRCKICGYQVMANEFPAGKVQDLARDARAMSFFRLLSDHVEKEHQLSFAAVAACYTTTDPALIPITETARSTVAAITRGHTMSDDQIVSELAHAGLTAAEIGKIKPTILHIRDWLQETGPYKPKLPS